MITFLKNTKLVAATISLLLIQSCSAGFGYGGLRVPATSTTPLTNLLFVIDDTPISSQNLTVTSNSSINKEAVSTKANDIQTSSLNKFKMEFESDLKSTITSRFTAAGIASEVTTNSLLYQNQNLTKHSHFISLKFSSQRTGYYGSSGAARSVSYDVTVIDTKTKVLIWSGGASISISGAFSFLGNYSDGLAKQIFDSFIKSKLI